MSKNKKRKIINRKNPSGTGTHPANIEVNAEDEEQSANRSVEAQIAASLVGPWNDAAAKWADVDIDLTKSGLQFHGGACLVTESADPNPNGVSYVQFTDSDGEELFRWESEEWADNPGPVMGDIVEKIRMASQSDFEYGDNDELSISIGSGSLVSDLPKEGTKAVSYMQFKDSSGREVAYWDIQEWTDEPEAVMGAIMGVLRETATAE